MPISVGSQTIGGSGGLPTPTGAGQVPVSSGAGGTFSARALTSSDVSGVGVTTGTYATMTGLTPARGDRFFVTSGARTGSLYECLTTGVWSRVRLDLGLGTAPCAVFDAEDIPSQALGYLREWRPASAGSSLAMITGGTPPSIVASSLGGMPAASFSGSHSLRLNAPHIMAGNDHTIVAAYSSLAASGNNGVVSVGDPTNTTGSVGMFGNFVASLTTRAYVEYDAGATAIYDTGTTISTAAGVHTFTWSWESAASKSRAYGDGSPTATASQVPGASRGILANASQLTLGCGRCNATAFGTFYAHSLIIVPRRLSDAEVLALHTTLAARFS